MAFSLSEERYKWVVLFVSFFLLGLFGYLDYVTGREIFFSFFYLIPIALISWFWGLIPSLFFSLLCTLMAMMVEAELDYTKMVNPVLHWNTVLRTGFFLIFCLMVGYVRKEHFSEYIKARLDPLTGVFNSRAFFEMFDGTSRTKNFVPPLTVAFVDLDDFKKINDRYGHHQGDLLLKTITQSMRKSLRPTDVIARMGGDEFVIAFPSSYWPTAEILIKRLREQVSKDVAAIGLPVTLSIGVISVKKVPGSILDILRAADRLMYEVKRRGKNAFKAKVLSNLKGLK